MRVFRGFGLAEVRVRGFNSLVVVVVLALLGGCQAQPGDPCEASRESGALQDSCRAGGGQLRCLSFPITCPDGSETTPFVCEGAECVDDDGCDEGFVCAGTGSVTKNCVPSDVCD